MNKTWENGKKTNFGPAFGLFWPKFDQKWSMFLGWSTTSLMKKDDETEQVTLMKPKESNFLCIAPNDPVVEYNSSLVGNVMNESKLSEKWKL